MHIPFIIIKYYLYQNPNHHKTHTKLVSPKPINIAQTLNQIKLGAPFLCGGRRRRRSLRLSQLKQRMGVRNDDDLNQNLISFDEGIDNEAYEQGNLILK